MTRASLLGIRERWVSQLRSAARASDEYAPPRSIGGFRPAGCYTRQSCHNLAGTFTCDPDPAVRLHSPEADANSVFLK
jgi:hypothetical protein